MKQSSRMYSNSELIENDVRLNKSNNLSSLTDMNAAPKSTYKSIASLVRNKSIPQDFKEKIHKEIKIPTEIYREKLKLECYKSEYVAFKNFLLDAKSLAKIETKDCSGLITVKEYSKNLSKYNEKRKFR